MAGKSSRPRLIENFPSHYPGALRIRNRMPPSGERITCMEWVIIAVVVVLVMTFLRGGC